MNEPGLDGRHRDQDGRIDEKRGDTLIGTLRKTYGQNIAPELRDDQTLQDWRNQHDGDNTLSDLLRRQHGSR